MTFLADLYRAIRGTFTFTGNGVSRTEYTNETVIEFDSGGALDGDLPGGTVGDQLEWTGSSWQPTGRIRKVGTSYSLTAGSGYVAVNIDGGLSSLAMPLSDNQFVTLECTLRVEDTAAANNFFIDRFNVDLRRKAGNIEVSVGSATGSGATATVPFTGPSGRNYQIFASDTVGLVEVHAQKDATYARTINLITEYNPAQAAP